jgi:hypothetical protein
MLRWCRVQRGKVTKFQDENKYHQNNQSNPLQILFLHFVFIKIKEEITELSLKNASRTPTQVSPEIAANEMLKSTLENY